MKEQSKKFWLPCFYVFLMHASLFFGITLWTQAPGALCAYQLVIRYCSVCVDIICVAVERSRKETKMPSEFQSRYHHVEEGQLSSEK